MLTRIFGDRPFVAVAKLLALSLLVGLALTAIGIDPLHLAGSLQRIIHRAVNLRSATLHWGWHCFLLGAMLVIPSWMLVRLSARGWPFLPGSWPPRRRFQFPVPTRCARLPGPPGETSASGLGPRPSPGRGGVAERTDRSDLARSNKTHGAPPKAR